VLNRDHNVALPAKLPEDNVEPLCEWPNNNPAIHVSVCDVVKHNSLLALRVTPAVHGDIPRANQLASRNQKGQSDIQAALPPKAFARRHKKSPDAIAAGLFSEFKIGKIDGLVVPDELESLPGIKKSHLGSSYLNFIQEIADFLDSFILQDTAVPWRMLRERSEDLCAGFFK